MQCGYAKKIKLFYGFRLEILRNLMRGDYLLINHMFKQNK